MKTINKMENIFGSVSPSIKNKISTYLENPTYDNWDNISSIIIDKNCTTVWQAILNTKPSFPKKGRTYDEFDNVVEEWEEIPLPLDVVRAIKSNQEQ